MALLEVQELTVEFNTMRGPLRAVDRLSFELGTGETLGIVGESGCGKSITSLALMGLLPPNGRLAARRLSFQGRDVLSMSERERRKLRGGEIGMIFQDPMSSLNPSFTVGYQLLETLEAHAESRVSRPELRRRAIGLLEQVGIPAPETRMNSYPHQLSGGMSQRVMIAIAIACQPKLLIADEPTTALDVTIQAQILDLLKSIQAERKMSLILITHDLGVVSRMADRVMVMYAGQSVETGLTREVIARPSHPYTEGLLACLPSTHGEGEHRAKLPSIAGMVPDLANRPKGCQLNPRCRYVDELCRSAEPAEALVAGGSRRVKCVRPLEAGPGPGSPVSGGDLRAAATARPEGGASHV